MVDWLYDELVLLGDAIRANSWNAIRSSSPEAQSLSALLSPGQLHPGVVLPDDFRTPNSVQRKSYDLVSAAQGYTGVPTRGGKLAGVVMAEFQADPVGLQDKAAAIRMLLKSGWAAEASGSDEDPDEQIAAHEGRVLERLARRRERDRGLRGAKLAAVLSAGGAIACESCGFNFEATYGVRGAGYIEVHHVNPLHVTGPAMTTLNDLALLCANCHRMCHRGKWITPAQLSDVLIALNDPTP